MKWRAKALMVTVVLLLTSYGLFAQEPITASNWLNHPRIAAIRAIAAEIDSQIDKGVFTSKKAEQGYD